MSQPGLSVVKCDHTYRDRFATSKLWNHLHQSTRSLSYPSFKRAISERLGVPRPPAYYEIGSKIGNLLHTRLRTEMSHLNSHLFQIQKHTTAKCSCGHPIENVRHYILYCPNYINERIKHNDNISEILGIDFTELLPIQQLHLILHGETLDEGGGRAVAYHFQKFIINSHRFTQL